MKLNHLNLCVDDLSEARHFFETFLIFNFGTKGKALVVMSDESGFILVLSDPKAFKGIRKLRIRKLFILVFSGNYK